MDHTYSTTDLTERKRGQHLRAEDRGAIQALKKQGFSNRAIARIIHCSPSTVGYELRRGTPEYTGRGRKPGYSAKRGAAIYKVNRSRCHRPCIFKSDSAFIRWMVMCMYGKYDYRSKSTDNSRNGHSSKTLRTSFGDVEVSIPRDRKGGNSIPRY